MKNDQAIKHIEDVKWFIEHNVKIKDGAVEQCKALDMAIKSLKHTDGILL